MFRTACNKHVLRTFSSTPHAPLVVDTAQLSSLISSSKSLPSPKSVSILDATWFMPNVPRSARKEFEEKRIPGAQFLDLDAVASKHELGLAHMMPSASVFAAACEQFGISPSTHVVLYDSHGVFSSPRALFMFRAFGHQQSSVLNGGLPAWVHDGHAVTQGPLESPDTAKYPSPTLDASIIRDYSQVVANASIHPSSSAHAELVLDARSSGRFLGTDPEPRPGLPSGHIGPYNSVSLPFNSFLKSVKISEDSAYTTLLSPPDIESALRQAIGDVHADNVLSGKTPVVTSCGSGMSAGILWLGLQLMGVKGVSLYDESWTGYAMRPSSVIQKGDA